MLAPQLVVLFQMVPEALRVRTWEEEVSSWKHDFDIRLDWG